MSIHDKLLSRKGRQSSSRSAHPISARATHKLAKAATLDATWPFSVSSTRSEAETAGSGMIAASNSGTTLGEPLPLIPPFTVRSLAERWECSEGTVRNLLSNQVLRHFRVGQLIRIPAEEVARLECQR